MNENTQTPPIQWSQRTDYLTILVNISDAQQVEVLFKNEGIIQVSAISNFKNYYLNLELFGKIISEKCTYKIVGRNIELKIEKEEKTYWPRITKSIEKNRKIEIDWSRWVDKEDDDDWEDIDESDEEEETNNYQQNNNDEESDSEEEEKEGEHFPKTNYCWYENLSIDRVYERLIDAYRLSVEDDYVNHGEIRGLYANEDPLEDFKDYIKLAKRNKIFPTWWTKENELELIKRSQPDINYAVEKSDIVEKYQNTSPFEHLELRALASLIYGDE
ncbi:hypothetical protein ABK040_011860 [Willaertia magna]